jgi:hypothetical protein
VRGIGRLRPGLIALLLALLGFPGAARGADLLEEMETNGSPDNRIDLVILGDGYTASQADLFRQHTEELVEGIFGETPWEAYRGLFNIYRVVSESAQSGADHPSTGLYVDTYFDAQFDYYDIERLTYADEGKILSVVAGLVPEADQIVLLINDPAYGGSGGTVAMASVHPDAVFILVHELGHSTGNLADEYTEPYPGYPPGDPEPNVDLDSDLALIKWADWIELGTPLPTPFASATGDYTPIGAYEGARYQATGIFRSAPHCLMQSLAYRFCDVCRQAMVLGFYSLVEPIDEVSPATMEVLVDRGRTDLLPAIFTASVLEPVAGSPLPVVWTLDGAGVGAGSEYAFDPNAAALPNGSYGLSVRVSDDTPWVRQDPDGLLWSERSWTITVMGTGVDAGADAGPFDPDSGLADGGNLPPKDGGRACGCASADPRAGLGLLLVLFVLFVLAARRRCRLSPPRGGGRVGRGSGSV